MSAVAQQMVNQLIIRAVKNLRNVTVDFSPDVSLVTGIFGPNGCGKSTILHLLACCYEPATPQGENYRFSSFFLPTSTHLWSGSDFTLNYSEKPQSKDPTRTQNLRFEKKSDRWAPRYESRPSRDCRYLGIDTCVPRIERETKSTRVRFTGTSQPREQEKILKQASYILNRSYTTYELHAAGRAVPYIGVSHAQQRYTELSMGAGEQRVFKILEIINSMPKYSLLLIDEIDLLLHEGALRRLIRFLKEYCDEKKIQLVFTAHRESMLDIEGINFRHITQVPHKTFCIETNTPHAVSQLTDQEVRYLKIHVEDDLAEAIANKALEEMGVRRHAAISRYGAARNAFVLAGARALEGNISSNFIFVLDGDEYREHLERLKQIKAFVTGEDAAAKQARDSALAAICQFSLPPPSPTDKISPEKYIWQSLQKMSPRSGPGTENEIIKAAKVIHGVSDNHDYVNDIITRVGYERIIGLARVIDVFSTTSEWPDFARELKERVTKSVQKSGIPDEPPEPEPPEIERDVIMELGHDGRVFCDRQLEYDPARTNASLAVLGGITTENVIFFSNQGFAYVVSFEALLSRCPGGAHVSALLGLQSTERVVAAATTDPRFMLEFASEKPILGEEYEEPYPHFLAISKKGRAFRFCGWQYRSPGKRSGRLFGRLNTGDEFVDVIQVYAENNVAVLTRSGKLLCCNAMNLRLLAGPGVGLKIVNLGGTDEVVGAWKTHEPRYVLLVSGTSCSIRPEIFPVGLRGGRGRQMCGPVKEVLRPPPQTPDFDHAQQKLNEIMSL